MRPRGFAFAWLLACLPAVGGCHKSTPGGMMTVLPDGSTDIAVKTDGSVRVTVGGNDCPAVTATAGPAAGRVGSHILVSAQASDDDPGAQLTYKWSAAAGSFASAAAISTTYTCPGADKAGPQVLTVTVSDGKCSVTRMVTVLCDALVADAGSGGSDASSDAGTAGVSGGTGGTGGAGGAGGAAGSGAGGSGTGGAAGACGSSDPSKCEGELCNQCTFGVPDGGTDLCTNSMEGCYNCDPSLASCDVLASDADRTKCLALYVCVRDNQCTRDRNPLLCYCGTADLAACTSGMVPPNGPCIKQFSDAARSTSATEINARLIDPSWPIGPAINLAICRASFCSRTSRDPSLGLLPLPPYPNPSCPLW